MSKITTNSNKKSGSQQAKGRKKNSINKNFKTNDYNKNDINQNQNVSSKFVDYDALKSNDVAWYNKNPHQYSLATRTPAWAHIQGASYPAGSTLTPCIDTLASSVFDNDALETAVLDGKSTLPGVMIIDYLPSIGISRTADSPVNKAFNRLMSELYSKTSGSSLNFQQADLAMMICSLSSLASLFASVKRMLGVKDFWVTRNLNYPRTLSKALGNSDYDDMIRNFNVYANRLNNAIALFNSIKIPSWFDIFARQYSLAKNIYMDEDSEFAQLYAFKPLAYWRYSDEEMKCYAEPLPTQGSVGDYLDCIEDALAKWTNSSDLYLINGALQRAFKDGSFIFVEPFVESERISPIVDENLASQCMNLTILDSKMIDAFLENEKWAISQRPDENAIIFNPTVSIPVSAYPDLLARSQDNFFMRSFKKDPTPDDNMEMTRLTSYLDVSYGPNDDYIISIFSCGTEVVGGVSIHNANGKVVNLDSNVINAGPLNTIGNSVMEVLQALSPFRYIPRVVIVYVDSMSEPQYWEFGDQYNYCILSCVDLENLHDTALYSIWKPKLY